MSKVITFTHNQGFRFTVKSEFLEKYSLQRVQDENLLFLMNNMDMKGYLHNEAGPAIYDLTYNTYQYWLDGKLVTEMTKNKMDHDANFNSLFKNLIMEDK